MKTKKKAVVSKKVVKKKLGKQASTAKKVVRTEEEISLEGMGDNRKKKIRELVLRGMSQGHVTQDEILLLFPDAENYVEELDNLYDELLIKEIDVFESVADNEGETGEKEVSDLEKELEVLAALDSRAISDPDVFTGNWANTTAYAGSRN